MESKNNIENTLSPELIGQQIKDGVIDSWRMDWLERNPSRLKSIIYRGKKVWFIDAEHDFDTARGAIDHGIRVDTKV